MQYAKTTNHGFSLIELLVVLTMIAITVTIAVPAFQTSSATSQINSARKALRNTMATARTEALTRGISAIVCASDDQTTCGADWNNGWIAFLDMNGNSAFDDGTDEMLAVRPKLNAVVSLDYSQGTSLEFTDQGFLGGSAGDFVFCYAEDDPALPIFARALLVGGSGVVRNSVDSDGSSVHEDTGGDIACP